MKHPRKKKVNKQSHAAHLRMKAREKLIRKMKRQTKNDPA
jgi:hypothetical protein